MDDSIYQKGEPVSLVYLVANETCELFYDVIQEGEVYKAFKVPTGYIVDIHDKRPMTDAYFISSIDLDVEEGELPPVQEIDILDIDDNISPEHLKKISKWMADEEKWIADFVGETIVEKEIDSEEEMLESETKEEMPEGALDLAELKEHELEAYKGILYFVKAVNDGKDYKKDPTTGMMVDAAKAIASDPKFGGGPNVFQIHQNLMSYIYSDDLGSLIRLAMHALMEINRKTNI